MFGTLIESQALIHRRAGGSVVSILAHGALIAAAVVATADKQLAPPVHFEPPTVNVRLTTEPPKPATATRSEGPSVPGVPLVPRFLAPQIVPTTIPPINLLAAETPVDFSDARAHGQFCAVSCPTASGTDTSSVQAWTANEIQMRFRDAPVPPRYPERLRMAGVEGSVLVKFIVDTTGRVDPSSIEVLTSTHDDFTAVVREALGRYRFNPAQIGDRKVRATAMMPFQFTLK